MDKKLKCLCARKELSHISDLLKTIAEGNRLKIICLLGKGELCVCEIVEELGLPHNLISHHLKVLAKAGIHLRRKEGRFIFYRMNRKNFSSFKNEFQKLVGR
ncbi:MAG: metalloregulator ArsR/SmtB family transcription factor [Candidatus Saganbacteria bacterium]|nr:metalloregulator ArsR/SmtB family transcription factor [Candidatus Saganbacteria bacterium]